MNGSEPKIEIFKPFGEAFELMKKVLFKPFEFKKWLVIGFAAWLANLGGVSGFNYRYNRREDMQKLNEAISQIPPGVFVADKNGAVDESRNEVVYVNSKENPYIFSIFTKNNSDTSWEQSNEAWVLTKKLSALLWKYYNPGSDWQGPAAK